MLVVLGYEDVPENTNCFGPKPHGWGWGSPRWGCSGPLKHQYIKVRTSRRCFSKASFSPDQKMLTVRGGKVPEEERQIKKEDSSSIRLLGSK